MPEDDPLSDRRAALGAGVLGAGAVAGPLGWRARLEAVADAMGTTAARLAAGALVGALVLAAVGWTLVASPRLGGGAGGGSSGVSGGTAGGSGRSGRADDAALPRASTRASPGSGSSSGAGGAEEVVVDAAGAVVRPGLYRLGPGVRVADVLAAAGGPAPDADLDQVNLAAPVADGDRVYVPRKGEFLPGAGLGGAGPGPLGAPAQPVNLNSATAEQLDALPGIGPSTARAIVAWRQQHGRFTKVDDLLKVRGIGPAKLDALRSEVRV